MLLKLRSFPHCFKISLPLGSGLLIYQWRVVCLCFRKGRTKPRCLHIDWLGAGLNCRGFQIFFKHYTCLSWCCTFIFSQRPGWHPPGIWQLAEFTGNVPRVQFCYHACFDMCVCVCVYVCVCLCTCTWVHTCTYACTYIHLKICEIHCTPNQIGPSLQPQGHISQVLFCWF